MEDHRNRISRREPAFSRLIEAKGIQEHIHLYKHHGSRRTGHGQVGQFPIHDIRSIGKNESNQGDAYISIIGKHGAVFQRFNFGRRKAPHPSCNRGQYPHADHDHQGNQEYMKHGNIDFSHIDAVENKAGQHDKEGELREGCHVQFIFPVQHVADEDKYEKGQDIV